MNGKCIILDGPRGMVKTTLIDALRNRLSDDDLPVNISDKIGLLECLVDSGPLQNIREKKLNGVICLVDTNHIFELVKAYYGPQDFTDYDTMNRAIETAAKHLLPDMVIIIDSLPADGPTKDLRRGYLWEASQRNYLTVSAIGDVEPVFENITRLVKSSSRQLTDGERRNSEPTPISKILGKKPVPAKPSRKNKKSPSGRTKTTRSVRGVDKKRRTP